MKQFSKTYKKYIALLLMAVSFSNCHFLEVDPIGKTTTPIFFSDMDGIRAALSGAYYMMFKYYNGELYVYPDVAGDMLVMPQVDASGDMVDQYNYTSSGDQESGAVGYIWSKIYEALRNVNNILQYEPELRAKFPSSTEELKQIRAQALFLRAMCHFDLCRVYAQPYTYTSDASHLGVPVLLKTRGADENVSRKSVAEVYSQIITDLNNAKSDFGNMARTDAYHVSPIAVPAMLSRVYLYMERWDDVITNATEVIENMSLSKGDDYLAMYNDVNVAGTEAVFRLSGLEKSQWITKFYQSYTSGAIPDDTLLTFFTDPDDIRRKLLVDEYTLLPNCQKYVSKNQGLTDSDKHNDPFVLRVSEMYLNRAEAYLNKNLPDKAAEDIKVIQARALGKDPAEITLEYADNEELARIIEIERIKELCFEGHRLFDITRRKKNLVRSSSTTSSLKFLTYPNDNFILPIPRRELDANKNMQPNPNN